MNIKRLNKSKLIAIITIISALIVAGFFLSKIIKPKKTSELYQITKHISTVLELPSEQPTLASITDITQLSKQKFFNSAQNGDRVLMYEKSGIAILYRPKTKKVINISTLTISDLPTFSTNK